MMAESKIEQVARAMRDDLGVDWPYTGHEALLSTARAAIEAMRKPTMFMINKGGEKVPEGPFQAEEVFVTMIDAALAEPQP